MSHLINYSFCKLFTILVIFGTTPKNLILCDGIRVTRDDGTYFDHKSMERVITKESKLFVDDVYEITDLKCFQVFNDFQRLLNDVKSQKTQKKERHKSCCEYLLLSHRNWNCMERYDTNDAIGLKDICDKSYFFDDETEECVQLLEEKYTKQTEKDINFFEVTIFIALGLLCIVLIVVLATKLFKLIYQKPEEYGTDSSKIKGIRYSSAVNNQA